MIYLGICLEILQEKKGLPVKCKPFFRFKELK